MESKMVKVIKQADTENETNTEQVDVSAANVLAEIQTLVDKADDAVSALASDLIAKKNEVEAGPAMMLVTLTEAYGDLSEVFPRPVAEAKDEEGVNGPHEYFEAPKPDATGALKMRKCNYFTEYWNDTSAGKAQAFVLEQLRHFEKGGDPTKAEKKWQDMPQDKRLNRKKRITNDKSRGRQLVRKAVGCFYVMQDVAPYADRCEIVWDCADEQGNITDIQAIAESQYPFNLIDKKRVRNNRPLSIADMMKLDIRLAVNDAGPNGSLYDALLRQLSRGAGNGSKEKATYSTRDEFFAGVAAMNNYLDLDSEDGKQHFADIKTMLAKKGNSELVEQIGTLVSVVRGLWTDSLQNRYLAIQEKKTEAAEASEAA